MTKCTLLYSNTSFSILCRYLAGDALDSDDSDDGDEDDDDDQPDKFEGSCDDETKERHQSKLDEMLATFRTRARSVQQRTTPSNYAKVREHKAKAVRADPSKVTASKRGSPSISLPASRLQ